MPKCAGSAVRVWLEEAALEGVVSGFRSLYPDYVYAGETQDDRLPEGLDDPRLSALTTHNIRRFTPELAGRRMHYFTLLRHPIAHFLSAVNYMVQERAAFAIPAHVRNTPGDVAAWCLEQPVDAPFRENAQTNHLALYGWCDARGARCDPQRRAAWDAADEQAYRDERLDFAKAVLRDFLVVGTVERIVPALELLRRRAARAGFALLPVERLQRINVSHKTEGYPTWAYNGPIAARLHEALRVDFELYKYAQALLDEALASDS